jgi:putative FmdB family regulatory protein
VDRAKSEHMPLYEYECEACHQRFEVIQKFSDPPADTCRHCGKGPVQRLLSSPAIQFKGSGWYITDYSQKGKPPAGSSGESSAAAKDGGAKETKSTGESSGDSDKSAPAAPAAGKSDAS